MKKILLGLLLVPSLTFAYPFDYSLEAVRYYLVLENRKVVDYYDKDMALGPDTCLHHIPSGKRIVTIVEYYGKEGNRKRKAYDAGCDLKESDRYWRTK